MRIRFGKEKRFLLIIELIKIRILDSEKHKTLSFIKISNRSLAIIRPIWIDEGCEFKWIFGWYYHPPINPITDLPDIILIEFHFWNRTLTFYRKLKEQSL